MRLNCDIGESFGAWTMGLDEQVMPVIDQANIACGVSGRADQRAEAPGSRRMDPGLHQRIDTGCDSGSSG